MRKVGSPQVRVEAPRVDAGRIPVGRLELETRRRNVAQVAAISAFEGLTPTPDYERLRGRYVSGEISAREFKKLVLNRWKRHA